MAAIKHKVKLRKARVKSKKRPKAKSLDVSSKNHKALVKMFAKDTADSEEMWNRLVQEGMIELPSGCCAMCGYVTKKRSDVVRHLRCVHLKIRDYQCSFCAFKCFGSSSLNMHVKSVHLKVKDFMCGLCGYLACRGADVNKHLRHKHKISNREIEERYDEVVKKLEDKPQILKDVTAKVSNPKVKKKSKKFTTGPKSPKIEKPPSPPKKEVKILVPHGRPILKQTSAIDGMMCHVCKYSCDNRAKLMQHFEKSHIRKSESGLDYNCAHCTYTSSLKVILKSHIITQHAATK